MKKLNYLVAPLFMFILFGCGSISIVEPSPISDVIKVEGKDKNQLYIDSNNWMVKAFNNAKSVIQFSDKENGVVTGKYLLSTNGMEGDKIVQVPAEIYAIINIQVKDNAAKITITPSSFKRHSNMNNYSESELKIDVQRIIVSFRSSLMKKESNDW
jgi:hypothetical protein